MDSRQFHRTRRAIQDNAWPGAEAEVVRLERALRSRLLRSGLFDEVEVGHTDDRDRLVIALCSFGAEVEAADVASRLEELWANGVSYRFWEAHALEVRPGHVELEAASRADPDGGYVTVHLVAQQAHIPAQRMPSEERQASYS
jgi:hypothetical protein